ncbi:GlcG/HbpS family heme-binding protein [Tropicimonas sp. S265A]|uniref:GlcG/HbpS family heme-binding protein n=1 Tax=Tropicimonas sp. S265A TaxID=3415134 RepID=UPI003C7CD1F1
MTLKSLVTAASLALSSDAAIADDSAFVEFKVLKPEIALQAAVAAMEHCRANGYQVGVAVVDRFGITQAFVRDRFAGAHTIETATRKAWTATSFRSSTTELDLATRPGELAAGIRQVSDALPLGGGLVIEEGAGSIVGGIGVSGAPGPDIDDVCAEAGIAAIEDAIMF